MMMMTMMMIERQDRIIYLVYPIPSILWLKNDRWRRLQKGLSTYEHGYRPKVQARFGHTKTNTTVSSSDFHNSWNLGVYGVS